MFLKNNLKTEEDIKNLEELGKSLSMFFKEIKPFLKPNFSLNDINNFCFNYLSKNNLSSGLYSYRNFPSYISTSLNSTIAHGIPNSTKLKDGDIITLDTIFEKNGYYVDSAQSFLIGKSDKKNKTLLTFSKIAFNNILLKLKVNQKISQIAEIIQIEAKSLGLKVFYQFSSHATGFSQHEKIKIKHIKNNDDFRLKNGFVFTIEPIFTFGHLNCIERIDKSFISLDNENTCQFEHTLAVCDNKIKILT